MLREFFRSLDELWRDKSGRRLVLAVGLLIVGGTVFYKFAEGWEWVDAFYFTMVTLTTVGYGDLHPTTTITKLFTVVFLLIGVSSIVGFLNYLMRMTVHRRLGGSTIKDLPPD